MGGVDVAPVGEGDSNRREEAQQNRGRRAGEQDTTLGAGQIGPLHGGIVPPTHATGPPLVITNARQPKSCHKPAHRSQTPPITPHHNRRGDPQGSSGTLVVARGFSDRGVHRRPWVFQP